MKQKHFVIRFPIHVTQLNFLSFLPVSIPYRVKTNKVTLSYPLSNSLGLDWRCDVIFHSHGGEFAMVVIDLDISSDNPLCRIEFLKIVHKILLVALALDIEYINLNQKLFRVPECFTLSLPTRKDPENINLSFSSTYDKLMYLFNLLTGVDPRLIEVKPYLEYRVPLRTGRLMEDRYEHLLPQMKIYLYSPLNDRSRCDICIPVLSEQNISDSMLTKVLGTAMLCGITDLNFDNDLQTHHICDVIYFSALNI